MARAVPAADRIVSIQALRFVAASVVASVHLAFAFADHVGPGLGLAVDGDHAGQSAVALFFIISGYVMVVSSRSLFGKDGARRIFWTRRCVRILPPYWAASLLLAAVYWLTGQEVNLRHLAASLFFVPLTASDFAGRPELFLWPGWTLFYEMVFYLVFGLGIAAGLRRGIMLTAIIILSLVAIGLVAEPAPQFLASLTRPVSLLFLAGIGLALLRERGVQLPYWLRGAAILAAAWAWIALPAPENPASLDLTYLAWAGAPALLLALAVLGGELRLPRPAVFDQLGNMSYAIYLLHVPLAHAWIHLFPLWLGPWPFLVTLLAVLFGTGWAAHRLYEVPVTAMLNRRLLPAR